VNRSSEIARKALGGQPQRRNGSKKDKATSVMNTRKPRKTTVSLGVRTKKSISQTRSTMPGSVPNRAKLRRH